MCFFSAGIEFRFREVPVGGAALDSTGVPLPDETLAAAKESDAVLLGAIGGYLLMGRIFLGLDFGFGG